MIDRDSPITEDELHAYIDGELPADRMEAVIAWLADHPEQAVQVASWRAQAERIRSRFGAVAEAGTDSLGLRAPRGNLHGLFRMIGKPGGYGLHAVGW